MSMEYIFVAYNFVNLMNCLVVLSSVINNSFWCNIVLGKNPGIKYVIDRMLRKYSSFTKRFRFKI